MFKPFLHLTCAVLTATAFGQTAYAHGGKTNGKMPPITIQQYNDDGTLQKIEPDAKTRDEHQGHRASSHAPIGVMGDHRHKTGEWMVSYRYMQMNMEGSRIGQTSVPPEQIATTEPNRFFGTPMQPPTLRVVPLQMTMNMHMIGAMYGLNDHVTLLAMTSYRETEMDHLTFQGGMGVNTLGNFTTQTSGIGDTTLGALIGLYDSAHHSVHANIALGLPTGSITETGAILTPMGARPTVRLPYAMQLGSGSYDLKSGLTYAGRAGDLSWGGQALGTVRLNQNEEGYKLGDRADGNAWMSYDVTSAFSVSARLSASAQGVIRGRDTMIGGPVQTADPDNYGGEQSDISVGANYMMMNGALKGHRIALEFSLPIYRDLNGPQLEIDSHLTLGWQKAF